MCLYYTAVEEFLFVKKADPDVAGRNAAKFMEGAKKLGLSADYLPRNAKDCEGYGHCYLGCPSGAKQSMIVSYIPEAVKRGADFYADCRVEDILIENGRAAGFSGYFQDHGTGERGPDVRVHGKVTVLSAGAIGTPLLLFRNRLCNSSGQVGRNYHVHPAIVSFPVWDEVIEPHRGISESAWAYDFEEQGFVLETTVLPPDMLAMAYMAVGRSHSAFMAQYPYSGLFAGMIRDTTSGRLIPTDGRARNYVILYQLNGEDIRNAKLSSVMTAEIALAAGARRVYTYFVGHEVIESWRDVERLRKARISNRHIMAMSGWHPMGTCRMGVDPEDSVVRPTLETWDVPDLFIVDASVFPSALGVNPQMTIMAFSMRSAGYIDERLIQKGVRPADKYRKVRPKAPAECRPGDE